MKSYQKMSKEELLQEKESLEAAYKEYQKMDLSLNMARGKPSVEQLDMTMDMMEVLDAKTDMTAEDGTDVRNYGAMDGIPEAKKLMADMMGVSPENVIVCGNASLTIMYDTVSRSMTHGVCGSTPWCKLDKVRFLCPVPGYDRHFAVTEHFGIEMINIPMTEEGPDMDMVEEYVNNDASVKGIWCVPKYSNPQGIVYSDDTVRRFAALKPAAEDFRIFWDNSYIVHHLYEEDQAELLEILSECEKAGNPDMVYEFVSTSKITFAGAGIAAMAASKKNLDFVRKSIAIQTIGYDKVNQYRHVKYFKDLEGIKAKMRQHANSMRPKFEMVEGILKEELEGLDIGSWLNPLGGYFITFEALEGCASSIVKKAKEAGVVLTGAGAPFPYGKDPKDSIIRIAPSYPTIEELRQAAEVFVVCVKLASVEKLLGEN